MPDKEKTDITVKNVNLDTWTQFKALCVLQHKTVRAGHDDALRLFIEKCKEGE